MREAGHRWNGAPASNHHSRREVAAMAESQFILDFEEWRPVLGWPYEASNMGRVRRTQGGHCTSVGRLLRPSAGQKGYLCITLADKGRRKWIALHRLICEVFHGRKPGVDFDVAHWNGDNQDNRAENLRWATRRENILDKERHGRVSRGIRNGNAKLTDDDVRAIRRAAVAGTIARISAERFHVHVGTIHAIVQGRQRKPIKEPPRAPEELSRPQSLRQPRPQQAPRQGQEHRLP